MIDIKLIREESDTVRAGLAAKNVPLDLDAFLKLDAEYLASLQKIEELRAKQNELGATVTKATSEERAVLLNELKGLKDAIATANETHGALESQWKRLLRQIPNLPLADVTIGKDDSANKPIREVGKKPAFDFPIQDHIALGESLGILDFGRAAKIAGSRFVILKGAAALLEFAIIRYTYDTLLKYGFLPIVPPAMIKEEGMAAMGYMDRGADEIYKTQDDLYLIGTSEQPTGVMHTDEIIDVTKPLRYIAVSPCFRREAGSYGKDTKGMIRVHQFDKLEMFSFVRPEDSAAEHAFLLACEEELVQGLGLPYQVLDICSGDLGDPAAKKYDIECWIPSQNRYRETHSTSNCTDFQSRRLNIRYKNETTGKNELVHTLNGTAFAIGRIMVAIIENGQQSDGSIKIPAPLAAYCGTDTIKASA